MFIHNGLDHLPTMPDKAGGRGEIVCGRCRAPLRDVENMNGVLGNLVQG